MPDESPLGGGNGGDTGRSSGDPLIKIPPLLYYWLLPPPSLTPDVPGIPSDLLPELFLAPFEPFVTPDPGRRPNPFGLLPSPFFPALIFLPVNVSL